MVKLSVLHPSTLLTLFLFHLCLAFMVFAGVLPRGGLDAYAPPVVYPTAGVVWQIGQFYDVVWDTSDAPAHITNPNGTIRLRQGDVTLPLILASNFSILLGSFPVQVPSVTPGDDYRIVLFGDSGDWSAQFTIESE